MSGYQTPDWKDINKVELRGRLGRDAESRFSQGGARFVSLNIATSEKWKDRQGEWKEQTEWHRAVVAFNDTLADLADGLRKGQRVRVAGKMTYRKWTDNTGAERTMAEVQIGRFGELEVLPDEPGRGERSNQAPQRQAAAPRPAPQRAAGGGDLDDDIPFSACKD
jgi:single-strand DNA-binding protein